MSGYPIVKISPWIKYPAIAVALIFGGLLLLGFLNIGLLERLAVFQSRWGEMNGNSLDFYGKAIDQYGQPVVGAKVTGWVMTTVGFQGTKETPHYTQTDSEGNFKFTWVYGQSLGIIPEKAGYEFAGGDRAGNWSPDYKASPTNRVLVKMWKEKGVEPMMHYSINAGIPVDGTPWDCNLEERHHDINGNNDLVVQLSRTPLNFLPMQHFAWSATVSIPTGGFIPCTDLYPNEAPADGYQPSITINMPANSTNWRPNFDGKYYFKSQNGKSYGLITIGIGAGYQPPPTAFDIEIYLNPSGSRNLEFDSAKQIYP